MHFNPKSTNPLQQQVAILDGLHSHVKSYITLTLWVYNAVTLVLFRLATMESESEDTQNISTFLQVFNDMLYEESGKADFVWCPWGFMTDENGANKIALGNVFRPDMRKEVFPANGTFHSVCINNCAKPQIHYIKDLRILPQHW